MQRENKEESHTVEIYDGTPEAISIPMGSGEVRENKWQDRRYFEAPNCQIERVTALDKRGMAYDLEEVNMQEIVDRAVAEERDRVRVTSNSLENNGTNYIETNQSDFKN